MELIPIKNMGSELSPDDYGQLEAGNILLLPRLPIEFSEEDYAFLMSQRQTGASYHKNIAYRPAQDVVTGMARGSNQETLQRIMRDFSRQASQVVARLLARYTEGWKIEYASFRPFEEEGRRLSLHARNDLLHFDAFPTRPTHGNRILRFFVNLHPERPRVWNTTDGFQELAERFAREAGLLSAGRRAASPLGRQLARFGRALHLPQFARSPYDTAMHRFHNFLKENEAFQQDCSKQRWEFPPKTCWMVFTDMVSHSVLSGQMAIEQTFIVPRGRMLHPERAPVAILERLAGRSLT